VPIFLHSMHKYSELLMRFLMLICVAKQYTALKIGMQRNVIIKGINFLIFALCKMA